MRLARILMCCLVSMGFALSAQAADILAWRDARSMEELITHLEAWLDVKTDLPRRAASPNVKWASQGKIAALKDAGHLADAATTKGLYDSDNAIIWLARPWSAKDPRDVSVLLHELIHHRQADHGHWYCAGAQELPAYRTQQAWLAELGLELNVNWIAIVLEAGCTRRDIHPD